MQIIQKENDINLKELIKPYAKKWIWFVLSCVVTILFSIIYIVITRPIFKIESSVLIKDSKKSAAAGDLGVLAGLGGFTGMTTNAIENEIEIFKSKRIFEDVVKDLKLQVSVYARQKYYDVQIYNDTNPIIIHLINENEYEKLPKKPINIQIDGEKIILDSDEFKNPIYTNFNKTISLPYASFIIEKNPKFNSKKAKNLLLNNLYFNYIDLSSAVLSYQKCLTIELLDKNSTVVGLSMVNANVDIAKDFVNNIRDVYNSYAVNDKNNESLRTRDFIDGRISLISKELGEVENTKEQFKVDNHIVDISTQVKVNLEMSAQTRKLQLENDTQLEICKMLLGYIDNQSNSYNVLPTNIGLNNPSATSTITTYNKLVMDRVRLLENATLENPLVIDNAKDLTSLKNAMRESIQRQIINLNATKSQIDIENNTSRLNNEKIPRQEKLFRNIERQQQIKENLFLLLLQKREEAAISLAMSDNKARVVDFAYVIKNPVSPKKILILTFAIFLGLFIPFLIIYLRLLFNDTLVSKHDLQKLSNNPILSEIPRLYKKDEELILNHDVSPLAESFRILVTNLKFILPKTKNNAKIILVTSTVKGEGKTFVSVNLSLALASPQQKVLVIGSDIRNPQLQRYNSDSKNFKGLTEYLYNDIENVMDIIHPSGYNNNCDFIYSGVIPPNPTELLQNSKYKLLLDQLCDKYDYIILDTAPLMLVTDSFLISDFADATIYVTRSEKSEKSFIDFANSNIDSKKIKNVAFVINDIHKSNFGFGNKYGYGYQAEGKKWWQKLF